MKKIHLNTVNLPETEVLSRSQMMKLFGGSGSGSGGGTDCTTALPCSVSCSIVVNGQTLKGSCSVDPIASGLGCRCVVSNV